MIAKIPTQVHRLDRPEVMAIVGSWSRRGGRTDCGGKDRTRTASGLGAVDRASPANGGGNSATHGGNKSEGWRFPTGRVGVTWLELMWCGRR
jgi:hypothetical protein